MIDYKAAIRSQYLATLAMLAQAVEKCPDPLWDDEGATAKFWQIAYHGLFYTHLYLQPSEADFTPWSNHRADYQFMGPIPWDNNRVPQIGEPYTKADIGAYVAFCRQEVERQVPALDLSASSGFSWIPMNKVELQMYNIRHLQHHAGELMERLGSRAGISVDWIGMAKW